jgi:hypothetical protein
VVSAGCGKGVVAGCCEHSNETSGSVKGEEYFDQQNDCQLVTKDCAPCVTPGRGPGDLNTASRRRQACVVYFGCRTVQYLRNCASSCLKQQLGALQ